MPVSPTQIVLLLALGAALGFVWYYEGRGRWRSRFDDRFLYGIPWGTLVTITVVVLFYLLAQGGVRNWSEPVTLPFVTWSYFYPTGLVTSGIAHGSPQHLASNMAGTLAFAPIVEYAWSHYPPGDAESTGQESRSDSSGGLLARPWIRAVVVFPLLLFGIAFVTALFSFGPGLGFSGAVFALLGFAVVTYPLSTVVAVVVGTVFGTLYNALSEPVVREVVETGTPAPPAWAGIAFQAHLLGFLLGVALGIGLLWRRGWRPTTQRVFFATLLVGIAQSLWLLASPGGDDVFFLYRGAGVVFVLLLTILVTVAVTGSDRPLPSVLGRFDRVPTRRQLAALWLGLVVLGGVFIAGGAVVTGQPLAISVVPIALLTTLLALPAIPPLAPDRWVTSPVSRRRTAVVGLLVLTLLVALPSLPISLVTLGDDPVPGSGGVEVGDYTVTYEENATSAQRPAIDLGGDDLLASQQTGVIVVSETRQLWTIGVREEVLEFEGNNTAVVGGIGWRETVHAERTGWDVVGNDTAYAVDLELDGETTRSFVSDPVQAEARIDGRTLALVPTDDAFLVRVSEDGSRIGETPVPSVGETASVGELQFSTERSSDGVRVLAETADTRLMIAEHEQYS